MKSIQHLLMFCQVYAKLTDRGFSSEVFNLQVAEAQMSGNQVTCQQEDDYKIVLRLQLLFLYVASMFPFLPIFVTDLRVSLLMTEFGVGDRFLGSSWSY